MHPGRAPIWGTVELLQELVGHGDRGEPGRSADALLGAEDGLAGYFDNFTVTPNSGTGVNERNNLPVSMTLKQNFPNPFNPSTTIEYHLPCDTRATLTVYIISGQVVTVLVDEISQAGNHAVTWNAEGMPSGMYFYMLKAGGFAETRKMMLVK